MEKLKHGKRGLDVVTAKEHRLVSIENVGNMPVRLTCDLLANVTDNIEAP